MMRQALSYAEAGWPVFPCQPGQKLPATKHGFKDATTDPDRIIHWWKKAPDCNVAIATGRTGAGCARRRRAPSRATALRPSTG